MVYRSTRSSGSYSHGSVPERDEEGGRLEAYKERCDHYSWMGRGGIPEEVGKTLFPISQWVGYITGVFERFRRYGFGTIPKYYNVIQFSK